MTGLEHMTISKAEYLGISVYVNIARGEDCPLTWAYKKLFTVVTLNESIPKLLEFRQRQVVESGHDYNKELDEPSQKLIDLGEQGSEVLVVRANDSITLKDALRTRVRKTMSESRRWTELLPHAEAGCVFVSQCEEVDAMKMQLSKMHAENLETGIVDESEALRRGDHNVG